MKPAFALDFRNDAIALLHRSSGGWLVVGRVALDAPDLPEALSYLRATALGLSPRGLATKLILPDEQLLVTTVDAPGPDEASRVAQIRTALEGRTPYAVEDLVFDWELVDGDVRVAVVARETLDEAESFATEHRFNPVSFAAAPAKGYAGEAFFGLTGQAATILSAGKTVERDAKRTVIIERASAVEAEAATVDVPTEATGASDEAAPELETTPAVPLEVDAAATLAEAGPEALANNLGSPPNNLPATEPDPIDSPATESPTRARSLFGLADDEPPPSAVFRSMADAEPAVTPEVATMDSGAAALDADIGAASPPAGTDPLDPVPPDTDEAPMAVDVEVDETEDTKADRAKGAPELALDTTPTPSSFSATLGFASRRASADPTLNAKPQAAPPKPTVDRPTAARPLMAAPPPKLERPTLNRPTAARPVVPKESKGLRSLGSFVTAPGIPGTRKKPVEAAVTRPTATAPSATANATAAATDAAKGLGRKFGARPIAARGKPRHLGLILTGLLLLALAVIAAWSTSLAFRSNDAETTELATTAQTAAVPEIEDEMLADGQDPDLLTDEELEAALPAADEAQPAETAAALASGQAADQASGQVSGQTAEAATPDPQSAAPETAAAAQTETGTLNSAQTNPGSASGDEIYRAAKDIAPVTPAATDLAAVSAQGDPLPNAQAPPPPFGTVFQFDANGLVVPTPEGIVTPEGVLLIAGKPPRLPEPRPAGLTPTLPTDLAVPEEASIIVSDPALAGFRPKARPAGLTPPASAPATEPGAATGAVPLDDAALPPVADSRLAGLRPLARPEAVLAVGEAARAQAVAANSGSIFAMGQAASAEQAAAAAANGSPLAVAISRKPQPRPRDLSRAVEAAVAAAIRAPEPTPDSQEEQVASAAPPDPGPEAESSEESTEARGRDGELDIYEEPELEGASARGTASASVAKQATFRNALALDKTALIGVYGTPSQRYAMIRNTNGRYKKVKVGDRIDGGKIQAITATEVRYQKGSRLVTLSLPKG
jgi:hypothetical protein